MDPEACPVSADLNVSLSLQTTEGKGRSPGHVHKSLPRPLLPDPNSNHTHTLQSKGRRSLSFCSCYEGLCKSNIVCHSSCRICAFTSHLHSSCLCHVFIRLATASILVPFPLFFLFPFLTLTQTPESYSLARMGLLKRRAEGKKGSGSLSLWNLLVNHQ